MYALSDNSVILGFERWVPVGYIECALLLTYHHKTWGAVDITCGSGKNIEEGNW